jgi:putative membrane protein
MERRLLKAIINPAMIVTWVLGLYLVWDGGWYTSGWMHAKFALVLIMSGLHGVYVSRLKDFAADKNTRPAKYYRILNEVPTLLMIGIVILVIVKPF